MAAKNAPPAPADDQADDIPDDQDTDDTGQDMDKGEDSSKVLLTVLKNDDGSYQLVEGDEDDGEDAAGAPGAAPADDTAQKGTNYTSPGQLMKGILDCLRKDEEGDNGSAEDNFQQGFSGNTPAAPAAAPQKY